MKAARAFIFVISVAMLFNTNVIMAKPAYPIILVHGINSHGGMWDDLVSEWQSRYGWTSCPDDLHICLNFDANPQINNLNVSIIDNSINQETENDIALFFDPENPGSGSYDIYKVDFSAGPDNSSWWEQSNILPPNNWEKSHRSLNDILVEPNYGSNRTTLGIHLGSYQAELHPFQYLLYGNTYCRIESFSNSHPSYDTTISKPLNGDDPGAAGATIASFDLMNLSNEEAIVKQGKALSYVIQYVLNQTGSEKVVLVCHSMGGLTARAYLQWGRTDANDPGSFWVDSSGTDGHCVAKLLTLGTPHNGSNAAEWDTSIAANIDSKSNAARDLAYDYSVGIYSYSPDDMNPLSANYGLFFYGGNESDDVPLNEFYSNDVSCDPDLLIVGLNNPQNPYNANDQMPLPNNIGFFYIIGDWVDILGHDSDGCVRCDRQYMNNGESKVIHASHALPFTCTESHSFDAIIEGLDEVDNIDNAYLIGKVPLDCYITHQGGEFGGTLDEDYFKFEVEDPADLHVSIQNSPISINVLLFNPDLTEKYSGIVTPNEKVIINTFSEEEYSYPATFYLKISGEANASDSDNPCSSATLNCRQPYQVSIQISPSISNIDISPSNTSTTPPTIGGNVSVSAEINPGSNDIDAVVLLVDGYIIGEMNNSGGNAYACQWQTDYPGPGARTVEVMATDTKGYNSSITSDVYVDNTYILTHDGPWASIAEDTFTINGSLKDSLDNGVSDVTVSSKINGSVIGQGVTNETGNYTISPASAPSIPGSYPVVLECIYKGENVSTSSTLTVTSGNSGRNISVRNFSLSSSQVSPNGNITLYATFDNLGNQSENIIAHWYLFNPSGSEIRHVQRTYSGIPAYTGSTGQQSETLQTNSTQGYWTAMAWAELAEDDEPSNNQSSLSFYVGTATEYTQYKIRDSFLMNTGVIEREWSGTYGVKPSYLGSSYIRVDVYKNSSVIASSERIDMGEIVKYDNNQYLIYCELTSSGVASIIHGIPASNPFTYNPVRPTGTQGSIIFWDAIAPSGSIHDAHDDDILENSTVRSWYYDWDRNGSTLTREFHIPTSAPVGTQNFQIMDRLIGDDYYYLKETQMVVNTGHDISVNSISPSNGTHFNSGSPITISTELTAAGGYAEQPNVTLSITNSGGYSYVDSEFPAVTGTQSVVFSSDWDTTGLSAGDYTISVTASIGNDINPGNNSQVVTVTLDPPPALVVNAQPSSTNYSEGDNIEIWATVTGNSNPISDADVVTHLTWPDASQINPVMTWDAADSRYECSILASQTGTCSGTASAMKAGYTQGSDPIESFVISNSAPDTSITSASPAEGENVTATSVRFTWLGSDLGTPTSQLQYSWKLDDGDWSTWSSDTSVNITINEGGLHIFHVKSYDGELEDVSPAQRSFSSMPFQFNFEITRVRYGTGTQEPYGWWIGMVWPPMGKTITEAYLTLPDSTVLGDAVSGLGPNDPATLWEEDVFGYSPVLLTDIENFITTGTYTLAITCSDGSAYSQQFERIAGSYPDWPEVQSPEDNDTITELPITISWVGTGIDWIIIEDPNRQIEISPVAVGPQSPFTINDGLLGLNQDCLLTVDRKEWGTISTFLGSATLIRFNTDILPDFDGDEKVNLSDFSVTASWWMQTECEQLDWCDNADTDHSDTVDLADVLHIANHWLDFNFNIFPDFDFDGDVDLNDYSKLSKSWLMINCTQPGWCEGIDLDRSGRVDLIDLIYFAEQWLKGSSNLYEFSWIQVANLPGDQPGAATAVIDGKLYLAGGHVSPDVNPYSHVKLSIYDLSTDTWEAGPNMSQRRRASGSGVLVAPNGQKEFYVVGGYDGYSGLSSVERYLPSQNIWQTVAPRGFAGQLPSVAVVSNRLHAMGGHYNNSSLSSLNQVYDRENDVWITNSPIERNGQPLPLQGAATVSVGNKIYLFGGATYNAGWQYLTYTLIYDTESDLWSSGQDMPRHRMGGHAVSFGSYIYLFGGNGGAPNSAIDIYDTVHDTWTTVADYPGNNCLNPNVAQSDNSVFVFGDYWTTSDPLDCWIGTLSVE